tara:strand:- start:422 stop:1192 length:771 start_codon:yes stop_codon:yes gene_type:complete
MSLFPDLGPITDIFRGGRTDNPKGSALGAAIGSFIPGVGAAGGAQIGDFFGDIFGGNDTASRGESGTAVDTPPGQILIDGASTSRIIEPRIQVDERRTAFPMQPTFNEGFVGAIPGVVGQLFRNPAVSTGIGAVGGLIADFFIDEMGNQKQLRITRKLQRDVKKLFMMSGGDLTMTAELYARATGRQLNQEQVLRIMFKTFSNNGPYVTRAAVRNMRRTFNKLDRLCDLKDRMSPPRRRAPARRKTMSSTSITQVK